MIQASLIALQLGERLGLEESDRAVVYYAGLLAWVGCHTDAYEQAKWFGDDLTVKSEGHYPYDFGKAAPAAASTPGSYVNCARACEASGEVAVSTASSARGAESGLEYPFNATVRKGW